MGNNKKSEDRSRRSFLSFFLSGKADTSSKEEGKPEMVKMLTPDGKLVEVDKKILDAVVERFKASKKDIYDWMKNPSKENS